MYIVFENNYLKIYIYEYIILL
eukprot:UN09627